MARAATVLIADDDSSMRQTMEAIVRSAGMRPIAVASGEEALRAVQSNPVDVMLLDVQMPGIGGLEVLRQVREKHTDIGVIMISVLKEVPVAVEAMRLGALDYVTKDFSPPELNARVAKTLEQLKSARELAWLREEQASRDQKPMVLGHTAAMRHVAHGAGGAERGDHREGARQGGCLRDDRRDRHDTPLGGAPGGEARHVAHRRGV